VASISGKSEERSTASLFTPGGTHAKNGEFAGMNDFEVVMWVAILPQQVTAKSDFRAEIEAIRIGAEQTVNRWKEQGKTRDELLREFGQILGIDIEEAK